MAQLLEKYNQQQVANFALNLVINRIRKWLASNKMALSNTQDAFESKDKQIEYMIDVYFRNPKHMAIRKIVEKTPYFDGSSFKNLARKFRNAI